MKKIIIVIIASFLSQSCLKQISKNKKVSEEEATESTSRVADTPNNNSSPENSITINISETNTAISTSNIQLIQAKDFFRYRNYGRHNWILKNDNYLTTLPNNGTSISFKNIDRDTPRVDFKFAIVIPGQYLVEIEGRGETGNNIVHVGLDNKPQINSVKFNSKNFSFISKTISGQTSLINIEKSGDHLINLFMGDDGTEIGSVRLVYIPSNKNPVVEKYFEFVENKLKILAQDFSKNAEQGEPYWQFESDYMILGPDQGINVTSDKISLNTSYLKYLINFPKAGKYNLTFKVLGNEEARKFFVGIDTAVNLLAVQTKMPNATESFKDRSIEVSINTAGKHSLFLFPGFDGVKVKEIHLSSSDVITRPQPQTSNIKWHPGHYVMVKAFDYKDFNNLDKGYIHQALTSPDIKGLSITFNWKLIESDKNVYDWRSFDAWAALARKYGKRYMVRLHDRNFGRNKSLSSEYDKGFYPKYLFADQSKKSNTNPEGRCLVEKAIKVDDDIVPGGLQHAFFIPECEADMIRVTKAMYEKCDRDDYCEAYFHEETSLTLGKSSDRLATIYNTTQRKKDFYFKWINEMLKVGHSTMFIFGMNYWYPNDSYFGNDSFAALSNFIKITDPAYAGMPDLYSSKRGGITHPDTAYLYPGWSTSEEIMRAYRGNSLSAPEIAIAPQMQRAACLKKINNPDCFNDLESGKKQYLFARNYLGATHIMWIGRDPFLEVSKLFREIEKIPCPKSFEGCKL